MEKKKNNFPNVYHSKYVQKNPRLRLHKLFFKNKKKFKFNSYVKPNFKSLREAEKKRKLICLFVKILFC